MELKNLEQSPGRMVDMMGVTEKQGSVLLALDDLARAMQADNAGGYELEWAGLARDVEDVINDYVQGTKATVSVNGVNLFGVCRVTVDAYEYRDESSQDDCTVGLLFFGRGNQSHEKALLVVDAGEADLCLTVVDGGGLVRIETVDKQERRGEA